MKVINMKRHRKYNIKKRMGWRRLLLVEEGIKNKNKKYCIT